MEFDEQHDDACVHGVPGYVECEICDSDAMIDEREYEGEEEEFDVDVGFDKA